MKILSEKMVDETSVRTSSMRPNDDFEDAGNGEGYTFACGAAVVAMMEIEERRDSDPAGLPFRCGW